MKETSYYELKMPDSNDTIDVSVLNNNMKTLDDVLILTVIGRNAETSEFVKKCCAPYIMIQNLGEETVTIYDRRWPEDMWEDNKIVIEPSKFYTYRVANSVNANFLVLDNKECNFRYFITAEQAIAEGGGGGGGGTTDYNELDNQPKINGFTLIGNKSFKELGLLNDDGKIKSDYLPPFVDNMDSYDTEADFPRPGVEDRLYLDKSTNLAYVWAGTDYACIGTPLALGITHETAGYGDESRAAYNHSLSEHARTDATKTEGSSQNGYVKINDAETKVYEHPGTGTNPHGTTKTDVGLGNVLDAKQVTVTEQAYSDTEKAQARKNIGAGTSSFSGKYSDLAEIPSEFTPAEHNHDDLYAHKTSVSLSKEGGETTSVINVTDAKAQMAMVAKISGKTQKNIFTAYDNMRSYTASTEKYNGHDCIESSSAWNGAIDTNIVLKSGVTYYIRAMVKTGTAGTSYQIYAHESGSESLGRAIYTAQIANANQWTLIETLFKPSVNMDNIRIEAFANVKTVISEFMVVESTKELPYFYGLASAPVESVVSQGKDNTMYIRTSIDGASGAYISSSNRAVSKPLYPQPNRLLNATLSHTKNTNALDIVINQRDKNNKLVKDSGWLGRASVSNYVIEKETAFVYIIAKYLGGNADIAVDDDIIVTTDAPAVKTTVLVPQSIRNLPDYGVENNIVDFENGTYTHNNTISNGAVTAYTGTDKVIPISDYLRPLPVESGGTLTLVNEHNLDVNSTIKYKKEV